MSVDNVRKKREQKNQKNQKNKKKNAQPWRADWGLKKIHLFIINTCKKNIKNVVRYIFPPCNVVQHVHTRNQ